jgi:1,4-alpha-glucan branching enzyme
MIEYTERGTLRFKVYGGGARRVALVGDFTDWSNCAVEMKPSGDGWWSAELSLPNGDHEFSYLIDGSSWLPDYAADGLVRTPYGSFVSRLSVGQSMVGDGAMS